MTEKRDADTPVSITDAKKVEAFLTTARERFALVATAEAKLRRDMQDDKRFRASDQWPAHLRTEREREKRPYLTINRLPQFIKQVTNQARQSRPAIQINPVDDHADPETADCLQGIVRHIENASHAQVAYDRAVEDQVTMGRGYLRLVTEWEDHLSFNQCIRIRSVPDPEKVYVDPSAIEHDYSDAMFAFEHEDLDPDTFKAKYPRAKLCSLSDFESIGDQQAHWANGGTIRVADYFYVELKDVEIALLSDGRVLPVEEAEQAIAMHGAQALRQMVPVAPLKVVRTRTAQQRVVKLAKITGAEVLDETEWPGKFIPLIPVLGDEIRVDGKVDYRGIVRDAKDQQMLYNYQVTAMVETTALAPKAPFVIADGQVEPYKRMWAQANSKNYAYLPYKPVSVGGQPVGPPQRQNHEPAIQAIVATVQQADNDLKATTGMYDASLGERGPEQSGKAILARQKQGEVGNSHFIDNLGRALWAVGRQLIDLIPKVYDAPRILRINGKDDKEQTVMVHAGQGDAVPQALPPGVQKVYDLGVGRFDVTVSVGPSDGSRRQEAVELLTVAMQSYPDLMAVGGDLYFSMMDHPIMRQLAARMKKGLAPQFQDNEQEIPPAAQAKLTQMEQVAAELTARVNELEDEKAAKTVEITAKKEIELLKAELELIKLKVQLEGAQRSQQAAAAEKDKDRTLAREDRETSRVDTETAQLLDVHEARLAREFEATEQRQARAESRDHEAQMQQQAAAAAQQQPPAGA